MSRKYIRLCTDHVKSECSYPERYDITYLFHEDMVRNYGTYGVDYFDFVPSEKIFKWIKQHYILCSFTECFHDREPHVDLDCNDSRFDEVFNQLYRDNWIERMQQCNWYEPYEEGIWSYNAENVEKIGYSHLEKVKTLVARKFIDVPYNKFDKKSPTYRINLSFQGRMFTTLNRKKKDYYFSVSWFGRDINEVDYVWNFKMK